MGVRAADVSFLSKQVERGDYYFLDLEPRPRSALAVVCGGREVCGSGYVVDRERFPYLSVEYVDSGSGTVTLDGRAFLLRPGSLFCYGPGLRHRIEADGAPPMVKYFVDFAGAGAGSLLRVGAWAERRPLRVAEPARIRGLFDELQRIGQRPGAHAVRRALLGLEQIILAAADDSLPEDAGESAAWNTYQRCRSWIESSYLRLRSLADVEAACGTSAAHVCRLFQRYSGTTPYQLVVRLRMARAAALLLDGGRLVREIGSLVGYDDPYHFSKAFKRVYGLSPEAFRARRRVRPATSAPGAAPGGWRPRARGASVD
jgi:AraC family transcriptional regulator